MTNVSDGGSLASVKSEIFEAALWFLPEWAQLMVLGLIVLAFLVSWILKLKRKIAHRRAVRAGVQVHAAAQYGQGRGADYLGSYAPENQQNQNQQSQTQQTAPASGPSGADFLGAYAPQQRRDDAR